MELTPEVIKYVEKLRMDDDMKQELYLHLLEYEVEVETGFPKYVYEVHKNLRNNTRWKEGNRRRLEQENEDIIRDTFYADNQAADPAEILEMEEDMQTRLGGLSDLLQERMEQHYVDGLTINEMAELSGDSPDAIYKQLQRGRDILKGVLQ